MRMILHIYIYIYTYTYIQTYTQGNILIIIKMIVYNITILSLI